MRKSIRSHLQQIFKQSSKVLVTYGKCNDTKTFITSDVFIHETTLTQKKRLNRDSSTHFTRTVIQF